MRQLFINSIADEPYDLPPIQKITNDARGGDAHVWHGHYPATEVDDDDLIADDDDEISADRLRRVQIQRDRLIG